MKTGEKHFHIYLVYSENYYCASYHPTANFNHHQRTDKRRSYEMSQFYSHRYVSLAYLQIRGHKWNTLGSGFTTKKHLMLQTTSIHPNASSTVILSCWEKHLWLWLNISCAELILLLWYCWYCFSVFLPPSCGSLLQWSKQLERLIEPERNNASQLITQTKAKGMGQVLVRWSKRF